MRSKAQSYFGRLTLSRGGGASILHNIRNERWRPTSENLLVTSTHDTIIPNISILAINASVLRQVVLRWTRFLDLINAPAKLPRSHGKHRLPQVSKTAANLLSKLVPGDSYSSRKSSHRGSRGTRRMDCVFSAGEGAQQSGRTVSATNGPRPNLLPGTNSGCRSTSQTIHRLIDTIQISKRQATATSDVDCHKTASGTT